MTNKNDTFASLMHSFSYRYDLRTVFDDFLTMTICAFSQNPLTGKSHDEDLYMDTIARYAKDDLRHNFPKMVAALTFEMENRYDSDKGNDVLGEFYETNLYRKGASQYFTPWSICEFMALCSANDTANGEAKRVLDPTCGSGRTLLAAAKHIGRDSKCYGIDIDHVCVKMAAINLFLNGIFHSEVMWADALSPESFHMSYVISFLPFGIFRIQNKDNSLLWNLNKNSFVRTQPKLTIATPLAIGDVPVLNDGTQLKLF